MDKIDENTSEELLPVVEPVLVITPEPGYNFDMVLTYKMIEDTDDQDTLFRIQFLQVFGITTNEYQPDVVSAELDALYVRFRENATIREILQSHPLYHKEQRGGNGEGGDAEDSGSGIVLSSDNSEMIFCGVNLLGIGIMSIKRHHITRRSNNVIRHA